MGVRDSAPDPDAAPGPTGAGYAGQGSDARTARRRVSAGVVGVTSVPAEVQESLEGVLRLLLPACDPCGGRLSRTSGQHLLDSYLVFPSVRRARLLLPAESPAAAATAVALRGPADRRSIRALAYRGASAALRTGLAQRLLRARVDLVVEAEQPGDGVGDSLAHHVSRILGQRAYLAPRIGPADPHRTLGMHVLDDRGRLLAYVKVTGSRLSRAQLETEGRALAGFPLEKALVCVAPRLIHVGTWNRLGVLVTSPMDLRRRRHPTLQAPPSVAAMMDVAATGDLVSTRLRDSVYWRRTRERIARLEQDANRPCPRLQAASDLFAGLDAVGGDVELPFGGWHGDWLPWNLSWDTGRLLVWDWEYWSDAVPVGFDMLHFFAGTLFFRERWAAGEALEAARERATPILRDAGHPQERLALVHALYVLEFLLRRLDIAAHGGGRDDARVFPSILPAAFGALARAQQAMAQAATDLQP